MYPGQTFVVNLRGETDIKTNNKTPGPVNAGFYLSFLSLRNLTDILKDKDVIVFVPIFLLSIFSMNVMSSESLNLKPKYYSKSMQRVEHINSSVMNLSFYEPSRNSIMKSNGVYPK